MFEKLQSLSDRYRELTEAISQPEIIQDLTRYQACLKERLSIEPLVLKYDTLLSVEKQIADSRDLLSDPDLGQVAEAELSTLSSQRETLIQELKLLLVPADPMDSRNVILEIRAGVGGEEAALFAADLLRMYQKYADRNGSCFHAFRLWYGRKQRSDFK